jgi:tRNA-2-methylthio-N6-dimethylallyladenosine synthase
MNRLDSELVASSLRAAGHEMVADARQADVVLYNTCSVRRQAENKVYSRLGAQGQRKASGVKVIVGVLGCLAQRQGEGLLREYPQVDLVCAPGQLDALAEMIEEVARRVPCPSLSAPVWARGPVFAVPCRVRSVPVRAFFAVSSH